VDQNGRRSRLLRAAPMEHPVVIGLSERILLPNEAERPYRANGSGVCPE